MTDYKKKIDYQFVPGPINLMWALDNDCWKAICILIDKENYWKSRSKVFNGYFRSSKMIVLVAIIFNKKNGSHLVAAVLLVRSLAGLRAKVLT